MKDTYLYIVEKTVAWEFDSVEYGKLARKVAELLYERGRTSLTTEWLFC